MTKRIGLIGVVLVAAIALSGIASASASAAACYEVSKFQAKVKGGNYSNATCTTLVAKLSGPYVLANLLSFLTGTANLWCAEIVTTEQPSGFYKNDKCTEELGAAQENESVWTDVNVRGGPTLLFLGSEGPTVLLNNKPKEVVSTELQSTAAKVTGKELTLEITLLQEHGVAAGIYLAKFFKTAKGATECETASAGEKGEIEVGEKGKSEPIVLQYIKVGSPLEVGEVFTVSKLKITCGAVKVAVNGTVLGSIEPLNSEVAAGSNTIKGGLTCSTTSGKPSKTSYINNAGGAATAALTAESGGIEGEACELIGTTAASTINILPTKMIEIMG